MEKGASSSVWIASVYGKESVFCRSLSEFCLLKVTERDSNLKSYGCARAPHKPRPLKAPCGAEGRGRGWQPCAAHQKRERMVPSLSAGAGAGVPLSPGAKNCEPMVRAEGFEPSRAGKGPTDFRTASAFAALMAARAAVSQVRGLDYPFTVRRTRSAV